MSQKNKKVLKYHTGFNLNIGFIVFFVIIIYVIFHIFTYLTSNPVSEYEVQQGTIATNNIYKGMIIREESVVYAEESGNLNYFVSNGSKVATSDVVYSVDTDGSIATQITGAQNDASAITDEAAGKIITDINSFHPATTDDIFKGLYLQKRPVCTADTGSQPKCTDKPGRYYQYC